MVATNDRTKASTACAKYCKIRDCLEDRGSPFLGRCITCGRNYHIDALQAGHAISGRRNAVLFNVQIIHTQCYGCNVIAHGSQKKFRKILAERHGEEWMQNQERRAKRIIRDSEIDFVKLRNGFERMYNKLMQKHGFKTYSELLQAGL